MKVPRRLPDFKWTVENKETFVQMWTDGESAVRVAEEIGTTRNSICGMAHRLKLIQGDKPRPIYERPSRAKPKQEVGLSIMPILSTEKPAEPREPKYIPYHAQFKEQPPCPASKPITIVDLTESTCRWPTWEIDATDRFYCGADKGLGDGAYCSFHARLSTAAPSLRRRHSHVGD
jgi:GcrA cell cycle regulator